MQKAIAPLVVGIFMAALPFGEEPHLLQKSKLLINGWLRQPMDWFDFGLHGLPFIGAIGYALFLAIRSRSKAAA